MQKWSPGVDTVLLNIILVVTSPVHSVSVTPSNFILYPPTVKRTRWVSALCGLISATIRPYVTVFPIVDFTSGNEENGIVSFLHARSYPLGQSD